MSKVEELVLEAKENNKLVLGTKQTIKALKLGKVKTVVLSENTNEQVKQDITHYTDMGKVELLTYKTSKELGILIGKPFNVSTLAIVK